MKKNIFLLLAVASVAFASCEDREFVDKGCSVSYHVVNNSGHDATLLSVTQDETGVIVAVPDRTWQIANGDTCHIGHSGGIGDCVVWPQGVLGHSDVMIVFDDSSSLRYAPLSDLYAPTGDSNYILDAANWTRYTLHNEETDNAAKTAYFILTEEAYRQAHAGTN